MRTQQEMLALILSVAEKDNRIRAVILNGSRANPNVKKDIFQDYDINYVVRETKSFREDRHWIDQFGERLYMQYPEDNSYYPSDVENSYAWLMQFADGNRLDLTVSTLSHTLRNLNEDSLNIILLDKDNCLPKLPEATDEAYWVKKPSEKQFLDTCNEFWWCLNNVAKGLWREEIPYVMDMLNDIIRPQLVRLLSWKIGHETSYRVSIGKSGKYMYRWLEKEQWEAFLQTYPSGATSEIWRSVFIMCELFHTVAKETAQRLHFSYDEIEAKNSLQYLKEVQALPKDAKELY
jgi:aminoglycoside 6-adenylyltransferase